jgi:hypothetical protein
VEPRSTPPGAGAGEQVIRQTAVAPESFDARFERILQEFAADRAEQRQNWDEQDRKWREWSAVSALAASADALPRSGKPEADVNRSRNDRAAPTGRGEFSHKL